MAKAVFNGAIIAQSDSGVVVEGNYYFPPESVNKTYLLASGLHTECPWKGTASYYHVVVEGKRSDDAAWYYPQPKEKAAPIKDYVAFWKDVEVQV